MIKVLRQGQGVFSGRATDNDIASTDGVSYHSRAIRIRR